ncbi:ABC transporter permease [Bacillus aquiflavi]|uniref:ABC transporter permease n=1 Tax=Bacillus aquiflavi TaxID=2672567 RepID=UPI00292D2BFA|nr:ABC transporter permease [Bacillus aquiflavi]
MFAYFIGQGNEIKVSIPVYSNIENIETNSLWKQLKASDTFDFYLTSKKEVNKIVSEGKAEAGVELKQDSYRIIITSKTENVNLVRQYIETVYADVFRHDQIVKAVSSQANIEITKLKDTLAEVNETPIFSLNRANFRGDQTVVIDGKLQAIYGFSLFFVIYTIAYNVLHILLEKNEGVWDRMILSPVRKWEMYTSNLLYSFVVGYIQVVLIFLVFRFGAGVDFYGGFGKTLILLIPYVFSIVAMSILITSIVKNTQQFNAVIPLVSVSMAMIGGAYWPLEIVSSDVMLTLSKFVPITYGMEALKGATVYGYSLSELMYPMSILFLMGVVMIGIGINFMEKRRI